ncbi:spindle and kinetochore-associated protein 1-like [Plakobranchus ocellatus]|uniref:SKA complex subunit 1 n=1 Tax=Plakobranchus ocellatus TaxID=259542 RepID=A0AAV4DPN5_9GAST|nr:spindle and kinetochore-associated protein 1-like [Plakobranchus ocellatus]
MEGSLAKVAEGYNQRLEVLKNARLMSKAPVDSLAQPARIVDELKVDLANINEIVQEGHQKLKSLEDLKLESAAFLEHLKYVLDNVPSKISQSSNNRKLDVAPKANSEPAKTSAEPSKPTVTQEQSVGCQYLDFLTVDEFQSIPKYMKGRLTYDKINSVIEKLDKVYVEKYKIRRLKKSVLNDLNKKRYEAYRLQETDDTRGVHFIVEQDIADFSSLKLDNVLRNIFTILRHCGLMYELRGGGYIRYGCYSRY